MKSRREPARGRLAFAAAAACAAALFSLVAGAASDVRSGDRFSFAITGARVLAAPGRPLDLSDRHKRLYERYRNRPRPAR